jgi:hypothetical protein
MFKEYEPAPEGCYRPMMVEYKACMEGSLSRDELIKNVAHSVVLGMPEKTDQIHFILDQSIMPPEDLTDILKKADQETFESGSRILMPYSAYTVEEARDINKRHFYEKFYKSIADKILASKAFEGEERCTDMAKWIKYNFDKFAAFPEAYRMFVGEEDSNLSKQVFMNASLDSGFVSNLGIFSRFFFDQNRTMFPTIHLGIDAPIYTKEETKKIIERFYNAVKGMDEKSLKKQLDGKENDAKLKKHRKNFIKYCADSNPEELQKLADIADVLYHSESCFMHQGAPTTVTLVLPRWVITLQEEFAGDWQGSYHPLLFRGWNKEAYKEEAHYINYIRC